MKAKVKVSSIGLMDMLRFKNLPKEREKHIQAAPAKEISAEFKINRNAEALHPDCIPVVVKEIIDRGRGQAKTFVLEKEDGSALPFFRAGQYLSLRLTIDGKAVTRPYTICSSPKQAAEGRYAVTVGRKPGGFVSGWILENLKEGDPLTITSPRGVFFYEGLRDEKNVTVLAGGRGITAAVSMALAIREGSEDFRLTVLYGGRTEESVLFRKELETIAAECDKIKAVFVLSDEEKAGSELSKNPAEGDRGTFCRYGYLTADLIRKYAPEPCSFFLCGPEKMCRFLDAELEKLGVPKRLIRKELSSAAYVPGKEVQSSAAEAPGEKVPGQSDETCRADFTGDVKEKKFRVTVKQGPEVYEITADAEETLLAAFERAGIRAPSGCRGGDCGWCRSRLVSGNCYIPAERDTRRYADRKYGFIHPCVSFPVTDLVVEVPGVYF